MKRTFAVVFAFLFALSIAVPSFAEHDGQCPMKDDCPHSARDCGKGRGYGKSSQHECPVTDMFMKKAGMLLSNKTELGLSAEQVETIQTLKTDVEKSAIRQGAEMQIFMLDIMTKLHEDKIDVEGLDAMIDKGSAGMSDNIKSVVASYAKLKGTLTAEQITKLKQLKSKK